MTRPARPARAVVGGEARPRRRTGWAASAWAAERNPSSTRRGPCSSSSRQSSGAAPIPPPTSSGPGPGPRRPRSRSRAGPPAPAPRPARSSARRAVPGPTSSSRNDSSSAAGHGVGPRVGEGPREVGPLPSSAAPARRRGEHVELPGPRAGAGVGVEGADQRVRAQRLHRRDPGAATLGRRQGARLGHARRLAHRASSTALGAGRAWPKRPSAPPCSSWREHHLGRPRSAGRGWRAGRRWRRTSW